MPTSIGPTSTREPGKSASGLETGQLGRLSLASLAIASYTPAVGMALAPVLFFSAGGVNAWPAAFLAMIAVIGVGLAVVAFARRYVGTGSLYSYVGEVFGAWSRVLMAATLLLGFVLQLAGTTAIVGIFTGSFLSARGMGSALDLGPQIVIYAIAILVSATVAYRGLDTSVRVAVLLTVVSLPLVLLITFASVGSTGLQLDSQLDLGSMSMSSTFLGLAGGIAFLVSFESCTALAAETKDPRRNVPIAVMSIPVLLGGLYLLATFLQTPGLAAASDALAAGASPTAALAEQSGLGSGVATATDVVLALAVFASLIGFVNYGSRFFLTLAQDGLLPRRITSIHPRHHSPSAAIVLLAVTGFAVLAAAFLLAGDLLTAYNSIAVSIVYAWVLPYLMITVGAVVLLVRERALAPLTILGAAVGFAGMGWLYVNGIVNPPAPPIDAMSWVVLVGIVVLVVLLGVAYQRRVRSDG
ncbi:amino acid transporter [Nocardioides thalensis]|uniref:Amino acid transporter n=1 Tax=Nocardioides thalensis TaxID=1914755 RepID=A0A853CA97_9ACTN|nr:APC family permease [Nocardioides thalensis]NYJ03358.1 amino acid transporter [Nocardioides thalensis]